MAQAYQQPGPYASGYVYPGTPAPGPPGPWAQGYGYPENAPPPQPPQPAPEPPDSSQTRLGTPPPAAADYDFGPSTAAQPPTPPGQPDYKSIVNGYLRRLTAPMPYPMPKPLTGAQALAVEMNPGRRDELLKTFNAPYERNLAAFQYGEAREGRAATLASGMMRTEATDRYRAMQAMALDAYRRVMAAHAGTRAANDTARTNAYVNRTAKGAGPQDWMKAVGQLDKEIAAAAKDVTGGQSGAFRAYGAAELQPENIRTTQAETEDRYRQLRQLRQRIQTVTSNPEFQKRSRDFQNRVVERLMSGFGTQAQEEVPPPPPETPADIGDYGE